MWLTCVECVVLLTEAVVENSSLHLCKRTRVQSSKNPTVCSATVCRSNVDWSTRRQQSSPGAAETRKKPIKDQKSSLRGSDGGCSDASTVFNTQVHFSSAPSWPRVLSAGGRAARDDALPMENRGQPVTRHMKDPSLRPEGDTNAASGSQVMYS